MTMFPVLFADPRTSGWISQWEEMLPTPNRKSRARHIYLGHDTRHYVPIDQRGLQVPIPLNTLPEVSRQSLRPAYSCWREVVWLKIRSQLSIGGAAPQPACVMQAPCDFEGWTPGPELRGFTGNLAINAHGALVYLLHASPAAASPDAHNKTERTGLSVAFLGPCVPARAS